MHAALPATLHVGLELLQPGDGSHRLLVPRVARLLRSPAAVVRARVRAQHRGRKEGARTAGKPPNAVVTKK